MRRVPRFDGRIPNSRASSYAKQRTPRHDTAPERMLRCVLWWRGSRYRLHRRDLPGKPDIIFARSRVVVFCDGDFWHGKDWPQRRRKLARGANSDYWIAKISGNMKRDKATTRRLTQNGWLVLRFWESDISGDVERVADVICAALDRARPDHKRVKCSPPSP